MRLSHILLGGAMALTAIVAPAAAQQAPRMAIANTAKILNDLQETKDLNQQIGNELKALDAEGQARGQKVRDLQAQRDALKTDSPQFDQKNQEFLTARIEFEIWAQLQKANLERKQKVQMRALFSKITQTVAEVATQKQVDVVFAEQRVDIPDNLDQLTVDQLKAIIGQRNILYNSATVDITNDVITSMDAKYKTGR